jgi:hypothetical protein
MKREKMKPKRKARVFWALQNKYEANGFEIYADRIKKWDTRKGANERRLFLLREYGIRLYQVVRVTVTPVPVKKKG